MGGKIRSQVPFADNIDYVLHFFAFKFHQWASHTRAQHLEEKLCICCSLLKVLLQVRYFTVVHFRRNKFDGNIDISQDHKF